jgi:predicted dinucleotide-utilizing enzyme
MTALLGPEFDAFLFASLEEQGNGKPMSVLSALARLDIDPWNEAVELARMPRGDACQRLTALLSQPSVILELSSGPAAIADRLVKLLPRGFRSHAVSQGKAVHGYTAGRWKATAKAILINVIVVAGVILAQWALTGLKLSPAGLAPTATPHAVAAKVSQGRYPKR